MEELPYNMGREGLKCWAWGGVGKSTSRLGKSRRGGAQVGGGGAGGWLMGGGLAGEQRVVVTEISRALQDLSLTGKAELLQGFRQGRDMPVLHFSKISSTTA